MKYEALTNASPSDTCPYGFQFRSGDKIELSDEAAQVLLKAGAIREIAPKPPQKPEPVKKGATKSSDS
jgi:hypothetical protein